MFAQSRNTSYETTKNRYLNITLSYVIVVIIYYRSTYYFYYSGSKYEDNLEQVSGGSLSTAILNRNNPKYPQQTASTVASAVASTVASTTATSVRNPYPYYTNYCTSFS